MYVIKHKDGSGYYAGYICGAIVTKSHITRAGVFDTKSNAQDTITHFGLRSHIIIDTTVQIELEDF
tara:strand:+ start:738 stop:935 length:198 start_codon:yes stop_codon:yes gene_type:complete